MYHTPSDHDLHTAYVSHLSHVSSFMLGKTVLEIEKDEAQIFDLASTGFASTVRLAKSDAQMWCPIFLENKDNVLKALNEYIKNLEAFRTSSKLNNPKPLPKVSTKPIILGKYSNSFLIPNGYIRELQRVYTRLVIDIYR